jgi:hypothetical protein
MDSYEDRYYLGNAKATGNSFHRNSYRCVTPGAVMLKSQETVTEAALQNATAPRTQLLE